MLKYENDKYVYDGKSYDKFEDALYALAYDMTWKKKKPEFKDIDVSKLRSTNRDVYVFLMAASEWDIVAMMECDSYKQYKRETGKTIPQGELIFKWNPIYARKYTMPVTYQNNSAMISAIIPALEPVFKVWNGYVKCKNGRYRYEQVLSFIADKLLLDGNTSPFDEALWVFETLETHPATKGLRQYIRNDDMAKARILAMQVEQGDLTQDSFISVGDMRKVRYSSKTKDLWGDGSYMDAMLALPPSMMSDDYFKWLNNAGQAVGKDLNLDEIRPKKQAVEYGHYGLEREDTENESGAQEEIIQQPVEEEHIDVQVAVEDKISNILGFSLTDEMLQLLPGELRDELDKASDISNNLSMKVRMWYAEAQEPAKSLSEKLFEIIEDSNPRLADVLPENLRTELENSCVVSASLEESILDWYSSYREETVKPNEKLWEAAETYCKRLGANLEECYEDLKAEGYEGEDFYRALPHYLRMMGVPVNVDYQVEYQFALYEEYGSTTLEYGGKHGA